MGGNLLSEGKAFFPTYINATAALYLQKQMKGKPSRRVGHQGGGGQVNW
jgi:hypothetical protein